MSGLGGRGGTLIGTNNRETHMKIFRTKVLALVPFVLTLSVASPSRAQDSDALLQAAAMGDVDLVRLLIGTGHSVNAADSAGNSVLLFAAANGQIDVVGFLIESGADVNAANAENWTPLMVAALGGFVETAQVLISRGAEVSARADIGMTALIMAAASGHAAMVTTLLDNGASVDDATPDGRTVLIAAAEEGHADCVTALLESGADPNFETPGGFTALIAAQSKNHTAVAWILVDAGAVFTASPGMMPELLSNPDLDLPDSLDTAPVEGTIVVQFIVDAEGKVEPESVEIIESPHEGLNEPVRQMALGAVFKPGQFDDKPVRVRIRQSISLGG